MRDITHTRSYHSANCDTDHSLVCYKVKVQAKKFKRAKQPGYSRIDTNKMSKAEHVQQFNNALIKKVGGNHAEKSASRKLDKLLNTIHSAVLDTFKKNPTHAIDLTLKQLQ